VRKLNKNKKKHKLTKTKRGIEITNEALLKVKIKRGQIQHKWRPIGTRNGRITRGDLGERGGGDCRQPSIRLSRFLVFILRIVGRQEREIGEGS
jgi:hypothetical protein